MTTDFFPTNYSIPSTSNYMKLVEGKNKFRFLSSPIVGYEYWNTENKPIRSETPFDETPGIKPDGKVKHFWAAVVYNFDAKKIQILELTQKSIMDYIEGLVKDEAWGSPKTFDIVITRKGSGLETEYITTANPHTKVAPEIIEQFEKSKIDLTALYSGLDPFTVNK